MAKCCEQTVAQRGDPPRVLVTARQRNAAGRAERHAERHGKRSWPPAALLSAAEGERLDRDAAAQVKRADPRRSVELVAGQAEKVDALHGDVDRLGRQGLRGVGVKQRAPGLAQRRDLRHRRDRADLVVRRHDRDQRRLPREQRGEHVGIDPPRTVDRHGLDGTAAPAQLGRGLQHAGMLDRRYDDAPGPATDAEQRQVVRLGRPRREDDFGGPGADQGSDGAARLVDRLGRAPAGGMLAVGVAGTGPVEPRQHGGADVRVERRTRQGDRDRYAAVCPSMSNAWAVRRTTPAPARPWCADQAVTPWTYQSICDRSASLMVCPAPTFTAPAWSLIGPVKGWSVPAMIPSRIASASRRAASVTAVP